MDEKLLMVAVLGFFAGYILKTILNSYKTFMDLAFFVESRGEDCLKMIEATVSKIAYIDQLCYNFFKSADKEGAKVLKLQMDQNFEDWKISTINSFVENYPTNYTWQLQYKDWDEIMNNLSSIYRKEVLLDDNQKQ